MLFSQYSFVRNYLQYFLKQIHISHSSSHLPHYWHSSLFLLLSLFPDFAGSNIFDTGSNIADDSSVDWPSKECGNARAHLVGDWSHDDNDEDDNDNHDNDNDHNDMITMMMMRKMPT